MNLDLNVGSKQGTKELVRAIYESPTQELINFISKATLAGEEVILCMDANEPMYGPHNGIQKIISVTGMVDNIAHFHGNDDLKTYLRGKNRIDYMFTMPGILPYLRRSGHIWIQYGIPEITWDVG